MNQIIATLGIPLMGPEPSSATSLALLAALPSPLRGEGTMEPYAVETHDWQQPSR